VPSSYAFTGGAGDVKNESDLRYSELKRVANRKGGLSYLNPGNLIRAAAGVSASQRGLVLKIYFRRSDGSLKDQKNIGSIT
jgi:hypothetical protein